MNLRENPDSIARPMGDLDEGEAAIIPVGPDGAPLPMAENYEPEFGPPHTAEYCPCERDCRHYLHAESHFEHGNAAGSLPDGYEPREHHRLCMVQPGVYLELTGDSPVLDCNRWEPLQRHEIALLEIAREDYYMQHPKHRPRPIMPTDDLDLDEDDDDLDIEDDEEEEESEREDESDSDGAGRGDEAPCGPGDR